MTLQHTRHLLKLSISLLPIACAQDTQKPLKIENTHQDQNALYPSSNSSQKYISSSTTSQTSRMDTSAPEYGIVIPSSQESSSSEPIAISYYGVPICQMEVDIQGEVKSTEKESSIEIQLESDKEKEIIGEIITQNQRFHLKNENIKTEKRFSCFKENIYKITLKIKNKEDTKKEIISKKEGFTYKYISSNLLIEDHNTIPVMKYGVPISMQDISLQGKAINIDLSSQISLFHQNKEIAQNISFTKSGTFKWQGKIEPIEEILLKVINQEGKMILQIPLKDQTINDEAFIHHEVLLQIQKDPPIIALYGIPPKK